MGDVTPKVRIDYADVRMALMEERYFEPIYNWHTQRGIIFGCDNHGRGLDPHAYGDYFRATRWYSAPGHDTPGGRADVIKGKVSSSIAKLYQRPRVWLEAYHSLGWGATPERLMFATRENYLYGCTLFNLHGSITPPTARTGNGRRHATISACPIGSIWEPFSSTLTASPI